MTTLTDKHYYLLLNHLFFDTPYKAIKLLELCPKHSNFLEKKDTIFQEWKVSEKTKRWYEDVIKQFDTQELDQEYEKEGIEIVPLFDPKYPTLLKEITDPPIILYAKGNVACLDNPKIAVVGARVSTEYGKQVTEFLVKDLCDYFCIVSGFAKGIDTYAHETTLHNKGKTIAVFGCGIDTIYPTENKYLIKKIIENKGLIISEFPLGTQPATHRFPLRNRVVSGMSIGVLVCEASEKSGSLITAYSALDQNRDVFAVPGPIYSEASKGTHKLIQAGAKLVTQSNDILVEYQQTLKLPFKANSSLKEQQKSAAKHALSESEQLIVKSLTNEPQDIEELLNKTKLPIHELLQNLTLLELKNVIKQEAGKRYCCL